MPAPSVFHRRALLWRCLALLGLWPRPAWGRRQTPSSRYRTLREPVVLPLERVDVPWRPVWFDAWVPALVGDVSGASDLLLKGVLVRLSQASATTSLKAFCLTCPHEICQVGYVKDTETVRLEPEAKPDHPLLVCPCHFSIFNPVADGARISGPAGRGLYRFRLRLEENLVEIVDVEEDVLSRLRSSSNHPGEES
ncbi:MAG: ubiquinol-cytochrome c reductase iron-sulfur subunit [Acidobacteriota bacterium]